MRDNKRSGFSLFGLFNRAQLFYRLYQDDRVPTVLKVAIPLVVAIYVISPIDLIPDFILGVGELDDLGVVLLGMSLFINLAPKPVVAEHSRALGLTDEPGGPDRPTTPLGGPERAPGARPGDDVIDAFYKVINRQK